MACQWGTVPSIHVHVHVQFLTLESGFVLWFAFDQYCFGSDDMWLQSQIHMKFSTWVLCSGIFFLRCSSLEPHCLIMRSSNHMEWTSVGVLVDGPSLPLGQKPESVVYHVSELWMLSPVESSNNCSPSWHLVKIHERPQARTTHLRPLNP